MSANDPLGPAGRWRAGLRTGDWPLSVRITVPSIVTIAYAALLLLVRSEALFMAMMAGALPPVLTAWAFGMRGAVAGTALVAAVGAAATLLHGLRLADAIASGALAGMALTLLVAALVGRLRTVSGRLHRERKQLLQTQDVTISALAYQAELRDFATGQHLERTATYVELVANELAKLPRYRGYLTKRYIRDLVRAAPLHDIGKVGVPDAVLLKPGKLSEPEFAVMKGHCDLGARVLTKAQQRLEFESFLTIAIQITGAHHERWDGSGYPDGRLEHDIPISARIMSVADAYDAMCTERVYKPALPEEQVIGRIMLERGGQFDPDVVDCFVQVAERFGRVATSLADGVDADVLSPAYSPLADEENEEPLSSTPGRTAVSAL